MDMRDGRPSVPAPPYEEPSLMPSSQGEGHRDTKVNIMNPEQVIMSPLGREAEAAVFSIEDLEVAKALTGLREGTSELGWREMAAGNPASPTQSTATVMSATYVPSQGTSGAQQPEPLLALLTSQHPLIASTINNSISAYSTSKTYSPRFRQGAEFLERNIASPMATTMETASRISGVETGVRWMLRRNGSGPSTEQDGGHKRRRLDPDEMDIERGPTSPDGIRRSRAPSDLSSTEFLPAYDDNRSPVYEEFAVVPTQERGAWSSQTIPQNWQTRLMITTSGLGVAMSDDSLRSLKYCLSWLRWANGHLNKVLLSLQAVLREWDQSQQAGAGNNDAAAAAAPHSPPLSPSSRTLPSPRSHPRDPATIAQNLSALKVECVKTLKGVLDVVSTYAGGALPENARVLVRKHLTSLPLRFQLASSNVQQSRAGSEALTPTSGAHAMDAEAQQQSSIPEAVSGARRVVVLAREGLDMMAQVGAVVDGTINSAEEWCERLGRKKEGGQQGPAKEAEGQQLTSDALAEQQASMDVDGVEKLG